MIIFLLAFSLEETKVQSPYWTQTDLTPVASTTPPKFNPKRLKSCAWGVLEARCWQHICLGYHTPVSSLGLFPRKVGDISVAKATEIRKVWGWWNWPLRTDPPLPLPRASELSRSNVETERNRKTLNTVGILLLMTSSMWVLQLGWERYPDSMDPRNTIKPHHTANSLKIYWDAKAQESGCLC